MILLEYSSKSPGRFELVSAGDAVEEVAIALPQDDSAWRALINFTIQDYGSGRDPEEYLQQMVRERYSALLPGKEID